MRVGDVVAYSTITLQSGAIFDYQNPWNSGFTIEDIAHGLSNICRYAGQCRAFYSVAEHCLHVSEVAKGHEYAALLHDAAEAFIGDVPGPLKCQLSDYRQVEGEVERAIFSRFGLPTPLPKEVKNADMRVLASEQAQIMRPGTDSWAQTSGLAYADITVLHLPPADAKQMFLDRFEYFSSRQRVRP
jgi:5'-deoxynucleotidase YfbR-like HD superfamily hydrolase